MQLTFLSPRKSLNKAWLKVKPARNEIEVFKKNLIRLLDGIDETESEEHAKNDLSDFLKNTFYQHFYINTKGRNDLVIHTGHDSKSVAGVLIEAKKPSNKSEMVRPDSLNAKAFHELILYYLRERITNHNLEIKHLVATNIFEWYIFDASLFEKLFAQNKALVKQFTDFEEGRLSGNTTDFFYKQIAEPFLTALTSEIWFTFFDFREYDKPLRNDDKIDDSKLIALYKLLSPEHLLKLPFTNDSNSLDKAFYSELLHIIGLTETKEGSKKLIGRKNEGERVPGSLIENAIVQIDSRDLISRIGKPSYFGKTTQEQLFNVSLELAITWINRILFLKLLEAQLINYHKGEQDEYEFLNSDKLKGFDSLDSLFFRVLAKKGTERDPAVVKLFEKVPYLNSSLFEPTELERNTIFISNLQDDCLIPIHPGTVLKNNIGKRLTGNMNGLDYLFAFLNAYDFSGEGAEEIQEDNKTLINASVLGLIFEKINGYKDGSFFTPGFITMYMCRETIRRAVVQKFNDAKGWNCEGIDDVYNKIEVRNEANSIINSLKICDPAVGSGHFLVSALNEIIAIKSDLKILQDREGRRLKEYQVEVVNDELIVTDEDGELFDYNPTNKGSQRVQEALFREKQTIIENCLFGVDINPNSVKICRLRLWIELLKNAFYKKPDFTELETLPNIDINIKCGNSLISHYALDADLKQVLSGGRFSIFSYREAIMTYRNAENRDVKREMEQLITTIKSAFHLGISKNDPRIKKRDQIMNQLFHKFTGNFLFEPDTVYGDEKAKEKGVKEKQRLEDEAAKLNRAIEDAKNNRIFENAFEWRFEFPEVLNDEGDFVGFDVVIGNPPYGVSFIPAEKDFFKTKFATITGKYESYGYFIELGLNLTRINGLQSYITPHTWLTVIEAKTIRAYLLENSHINQIIKLPKRVFEDATVETIIYLNRKQQFLPRSTDALIHISIFDENQIIDKISSDDCVQFAHNQSDWKNTDLFNILVSPANQTVLLKCQVNSKPFSEFCDFSVGVQAYDICSGQSPEIIESRPYHSDLKNDESFVKELNGKDILRYSFTWPGNTWISYGNWLAHPRQKYFFEGERILVREITNKGKYKIFACMADEFMVNYKSVLNIILKDKAKEGVYNLKFFLGILNSSLISWFFNFTSNKVVTQTFPRISILDIKRFPIRRIDLSDQKLRNTHDLIALIVDQILSTKKTDPNADTSSLENEIDQLVYELYGLTEDEINIIKKSP